MRVLVHVAVQVPVCIHDHLLNLSVNLIKIDMSCRLPMVLRCMILLLFFFYFDIFIDTQTNPFWKCWVGKPQFTSLQRKYLSKQFGMNLKEHIQLKPVNSNFRITRVFLPVPNFLLHKVTKFTSDNSRSDNSKFRLTRAGFPVPRP